MTILKPKAAVPPDGPTAPEKSWIPILADWKKSGLGPREFCRRRRLRESAFWFWKREIPDRDRRDRVHVPRPVRLPFAHLEDHRSTK